MQGGQLEEVRHKAGGDLCWQKLPDGPRFLLTCRTGAAGGRRRVAGWLACPTHRPAPPGALQPRGRAVAKGSPWADPGALGRQRGAGWWVAPGCAWCPSACAKTSCPSVLWRWSPKSFPQALLGACLSPVLLLQAWGALWGHPVPTDRQGGAARAAPGRSPEQSPSPSCPIPINYRRGKAGAAHGSHMGWHSPTAQVVGWHLLSRGPTDRAPCCGSRDLPEGCQLAAVLCGAGWPDAPAPLCLHGSGIRSRDM